MSALVVTFLLMTVCSVHAGFAGFEVGDGVGYTGGVVGVCYVVDKSVSMPIGPGVRVRLMEVQLTFADGKTKRHTMLSAGTHTLRAPLPIESVEILGLLCLLALVYGVIALLSSPFPFRHAEPTAPPNDGPATLFDDSGAAEGPPSVS